MKKPFIPQKAAKRLEYIYIIIGALAGMSFFFSIIGVSSPNIILDNGLIFGSFALGVWFLKRKKFAAIVGPAYYTFTISLSALMSLGSAATVIALFVAAIFLAFNAWMISTLMKLKKAKYLK